MIVLGIDQSYNSSGIIVMDDDNIIHLETYKSNPNNNRYSQAHEIALYLGKIISKYNADVVAIEGLAFGMRGNVTRDLGGLLFVIVSHIQENLNVNVNILPPTTIKKFATGSGKAKKSDMIDALPNDVKDEFIDYGVKISTGLKDLADSYWICRLAYDNAKNKAQDDT